LKDFKFIQENIKVFFEDKFNQEQIENFPTNKGLAMKRWKFCQKVEV
jgi:hypothetical protein